VPRPLAETVALGLLQGPAELLPVSSSAHVELLPWLLGWEHARLSGERRKEVAVALHAGTAVALAAARGRRVLARPWLLAASFAPPAVFGLALEQPIQRYMGTPRTTALGLVAGSVALVAAERVHGRREASSATLVDALWLGAAQACALVPGVSRSGATRAVARARGFSPAAAVALSEEVALPVLAGATVLKGVRVVRRRAPASDVVALGAGAVAATVSSAAALRFERRVRAPAAVWAAYRVGLAALVWARSDRSLRENRRR
jgi:undecaprenyl-diphosphatase